MTIRDELAFAYEQTEPRGKYPRYPIGYRRNYKLTKAEHAFVQWLIFSVANKELREMIFSEYNKKHFPQTSDYEEIEKSTARSIYNMIRSKGHPYYDDRRRVG